MISLKNVGKDFKIVQKKKGILGSAKSLFKRNYKMITALSDITFDINDGEVVSILGANGAGKSTCIKIMTGILSSDYGSIQVNGIDPFRERVQYVKNIGVVFGQRTQLWWELSVEDSFDIVKQMYDIPVEVFNRNLKLLDELTGLKSLFKKPMRTLSLGQRMLCEISAAFVHSPRIVFLDEPTIGLDVSIKSKIHDLIQVMHDRYGTTIVLTSHDISDITALSERIIIIDKGKTIYDGKLNELHKVFGESQTIKIGMPNSARGNEFACLLKEKYAEFYQSLSCSGNEIEFKYSKGAIDLSSLIEFISLNGETDNIELKGPDIEYVLKRIYGGEIL